MKSLAHTNYSVRESARARHPRLKLSLRDGLVVVVPKGFDRERIPQLLHQKRAWLESATERVEEQRKFFRPGPPGGAPERICLRAVGKEWSVDYRPTAAGGVTTVERPEQRLLAYGDTDDVGACHISLGRWLGRMAHRELVPWLARIADETGLAFERTFVKAQRTRWASCSRHRAITLNLKLLFLPHELVRYVFIHELCHTIQMNHSVKFWATVRAQCPGFEELDEELRLAWRLVPSWVGSQKMSLV